MGWTRNRKLAVVGVGVAVLAISTSAVAMDAGGSGNNTVIGCYATRTGDLRVVARAKDCRRDEQVIRWNKQGKRGPVGPAGADGDAGPSGAPGQAGATLLSGTGAPGVDVGNDGDFYVDPVAGTLYGPMVDGAWPDAPTSLRGPQGPAGSNGADGKTILNGTVPPGDTLGTAGDFYLDTATLKLYGPRTTVWPTGVSLQGPAGAPAAGTTYTASSGAPDNVGALGSSSLNGTALPLSGVGLQHLPAVGAGIDLTPSEATPSVVQIFPRDTVLRSISARASVTSLGVGFDSLTLHASLYVGPPGGASATVLTKVSGATCSMAPLTSVDLVGSVVDCTTTGLSIPIASGSTGLIVISATDTGVGGFATVTAQYATGLTTD